MASSDAGDLIGEIDSRISELGLVKKQLKKPSTISFAERRELTGKADLALTELQTRRAALAEAPAEGEEESAATLLEEARAALETADTLLSRVGGSQHGGGARGAGSSAKRLPGEQQRGPGGSSAGSVGRTSRRIASD